LALEPDNAEANLLLGKILVKQNKAAEAIKPLEKAVGLDPEDPIKHLQLARAYRQIGRQPEADREFAEIKRLNAKRLNDDRTRLPQQP
jgi:Flp pilus assembly protein TadD